MAKRDERQVLRMSWRRQPNETGLARMVQGPRGWDLRVAGETKKVGNVRPKLGLGRTLQGWYFYGSDESRGVPSENSASGGYVRTPEEAMAQAELHFLKHLGEKYRLVIRRPRGRGTAATLEGANHG